jgi:hypothetical protein
VLECWSNASTPNLEDQENGENGHNATTKNYDSLETWRKKRGRPRRTWKYGIYTAVNGRDLRMGEWNNHSKAREYESRKAPSDVLIRARARARVCVCVCVSYFIVNTGYGPTRYNRLVVVHTDTVFNIRVCHSRFKRAATMRSPCPCPFLGVNKSAPVSLVRYRLDDPRSVSQLGQEIFFPPKRTHRLWGPPSLVFGGYRGAFPGVKWLWACSSTTHLYTPSRFKNEWRYTSTTSLLPHDVGKDAFTFLFHIFIMLVDRDSSVGTATRYGLDAPGIESRWGRDFPHLSTPTLGPNQPPVQWIRLSLPWVKAAGA